MPNAEKKKYSTGYVGLRPLMGVALAVGILTTGGCATNPVTGKRELYFLDEGWERSAGKKSYLPLQQLQGGTQKAFPELNQYVSRVGYRVAETSDRPQLPFEFVVLNNPIPNAWALPGGKIAINRGLLVELQDEAELAAVLSHEIVHAAARHGAKQTQRNIFTQAGLVMLGIGVENHDYQDIIMVGADISSQMAGQAYSRSAELEADRYGIRYLAKAGYDAQAAVDLQKTFVRLAEDKKPAWLSGLFASHPPSRERVLANRKSVAMLKPGGQRDRATYQTVIHDLKKAQPAYDKLQKGYEVLQTGNAAQALLLAEEAIAIEPREAHFYNLAAKALARNEDYARALSMLEKALKRNDAYFDYYLQRGLIEQKRGNTALAQQNFMQSTRLLPTAQAHHGLGMIAMANGDTNKAIKHFQVGAANQSPAGLKSFSMLTRLDLPQNPQRYIRLEGRRNQKGYLTLTATNRSPLPIWSVSVQIGIHHPDGRPSPKYNVTFPQQIEPNKTGVTPTHIGPFSSDAQLANTVRLVLISARVVD